VSKILPEIFRVFSIAQIIFARLFILAAEKTRKEVTSKLAKSGRAEIAERSTRARWSSVPLPEPMPVLRKEHRNYCAVRTEV
jgi:hypothetical protein